MPGHEDWVWEPLFYITPELGGVSSRTGCGRQNLKAGKWDSSTEMSFPHYRSSSHLALT